jgi:hypothetical protein
LAALRLTVRRLGDFFFPDEAEGLRLGALRFTVRRFLAVFEDSDADSIFIFYIY